MFQEWGFLITEMMMLIILAAVLGLFVGWLIWARRKPGPDAVDSDATAELAKCRESMAQTSARLAQLEAELAAASDFDGDGVAEGTDEGVKPTTLAAPRDGKGDDLKQIKGVGPKLEALCHQLGFWHFDQIAAWSDQEVAWVDANLEGFKGRVTRDHWVAQAKQLAAGEETEFSKRVKDGDVY